MLAGKFERDKLMMIARLARGRQRFVANRVVAGISREIIAPRLALRTDFAVAFADSNKTPGCADENVRPQLNARSVRKSCHSMLQRPIDQHRRKVAAIQSLDLAPSVLLGRASLEFIAC